MDEILSEFLSLSTAFEIISETQHIDRSTGHSVLIPKNPLGGVGWYPIWFLGQQTTKLNVPTTSNHQPINYVTVCISRK
jgi:hypothetical protein